MKMFWKRKDEVREGLFTLRVNGKDIITPDDIWRLVKKGALKVYVPVDPRVSPWAVPKLMELSNRQAREYLDALADTTEERKGQFKFVLRADGKVAIVHNGDFYENGSSGMSHLEHVDV